MVELIGLLWKFSEPSAYIRASPAMKRPPPFARRFLRGFDGDSAWVWRLMAARLFVGIPPHTRRLSANQVDAIYPSLALSRFHGLPMSLGRDILQGDAFALAQDRQG